MRRSRPWTTRYWASVLALPALVSSVRHPTCTKTQPCFKVSTVLIFSRPIVVPCTNFLLSVAARRVTVTGVGTPIDFLSAAMARVKNLVVVAFGSATASLDYIDYIGDH